MAEYLSIFSYPAVRISNRLGILNEPAAPYILPCNNIGKDENCDSSSLKPRTEYCEDGHYYHGVSARIGIIQLSARDEWDGQWQQSSGT